MPSPAHELLRRVFGFPGFRGEQEAVVGHVAAGGDCLVLMPTGAGKSLCYQVPALLREGTGLVVSPLIALMQDQVEALVQLGVRAAYLNSTLPGDEAARVNALLTGEIDLTMAINPRSVDRIKGSARHALFETKAGVYTDLIMRRDSGPGANPDFVLAMKHLFNREQMVKSILLGYGEVANDHPIHPSNRFHFKGLKQRPFDLDKAKWHAQKANIGNVSIPVVVSPAATNSVEMALVMQHAAKQVGLSLDVRRMPADGYWSQHWMKHPVGFGNINPRPSADALLTQFFKSDAPWNEAGWKNPKFDQLLVAARAETNTAKRAQMYADMQVMIHEDGGIGIPFFMSSLDAHSRKLKGLSSIPLGGLMGYQFAENVWLEA